MVSATPAPACSARTEPVLQAGAAAEAEQFAEGELVHLIVRVIKSVAGDLPDIEAGLFVAMPTTYHPQGAHYHTAPLRSIRKIVAAA